MSLFPSPRASLRRAWTRAGVRATDQMATALLIVQSRLAPGFNSGPYLDITLVSSLPRPDVDFCPPVISQEVASTFRKTSKGDHVPCFLFPLMALLSIWPGYFLLSHPLNKIYHRVMLICSLKHLLNSSISLQFFHHHSCQVTAISFLHGWCKVLLNRCYLFSPACPHCHPPKLSE